MWSLHCTTLSILLCCTLPPPSRWEILGVTSRVPSRIGESSRKKALSLVSFGGDVVHKADEIVSSVETLVSLTARVVPLQSLMTSYLSAVKSVGNAVCIPPETERDSGETPPPCALTDVTDLIWSIFPTQGWKTVDLGSLNFFEDFQKTPVCL